MKRLGWFIFIFLAIGVGIYPMLYLLVDGKIALLSSKPDEVLQKQIWWLAFYTHISFGAVTLLIGWSQFSEKLRTRRTKLHRVVGKIYLIAVAFAGIAGFYLALDANGGWIAQMGFTLMSIFWLATSLLAYLTIRKLKIDEHRAWMIRSYALAFSAVTLRLYLPFFDHVLGMSFNESYTIIAWLCWVPNLFLAQYFISRN